MEAANHLMLVASGLIVFAIMAGAAFSRIGAPLLLVFMALGMLAGEDGPGGIGFSDYRLAHSFGSLALALILFDGGLNTSRQIMRKVLKPALLLATVGVVVTGGVTGLAAVWLLDLRLEQGLLVGSIVASTDAAAVLLLLRVGGLQLSQKVEGALEVESGLNDPMAIFLTLMCVEFVINGLPGSWAQGAHYLGLFAWEMGGGLAIGLAGGLAVLLLVNRLPLASGLYPILASALALVVFSFAQTIHASGFLAIYVVGFVLGNNYFPSSRAVSRFSDGMAWLAQISMFLMMGLLVSPSALVPLLVPAFCTAAVLILVARPLAVFLSLAPVGFTGKETVFIGWVGLRGAVPIILAIIPVLVHAPQGHKIFSVAYIVVLSSLIVQGWTIRPFARWLGLDLGAPETSEEEKPRADFVLDPHVSAGVVAEAYGLSLSVGEHRLTLDQLVRTRLGGDAVEGARVPIGVADLVIREMDEGIIRQLGLELDPDRPSASDLTLGGMYRRAARMVRSTFATAK
ncbi:MAG: potassium/proton antiporter [Parvibaculaceae bacterium]|nr:potassium/proton antiporter [Parvibaculaceae bacterium]